MPEVKYLGSDRIDHVYKKTDGTVVVTFRRSPDGTRRAPSTFLCLDDYLAAVKRVHVQKTIPNTQSD